MRSSACRASGRLRGVATRRLRELGDRSAENVLDDEWLSVCGAHLQYVIDGAPATRLPDRIAKRVGSPDCGAPRAACQSWFDASRLASPRMPPSVAESHGTMTS